MPSNKILSAAKAKFQGVAKIVTHPGHAHEDEILALAIVLALLKKTPKVERRLISAKDLEDPAVVVLDIGRSYNPELNNFDHHHDQTLPCTLGLVLEHVGLHEVFLNAQPWYKNFTLADLRGLGAVGEAYGLSENSLLELRSPFGDFFLQHMVERHKDVLPQHSVSFLKEMGMEYINQSLEMEAELKRLNALIIHQTPGGVRYVIDLCLSKPRRLWARNNGIDAVLALRPLESLNGGQISLIRSNDHALDFCQIDERSRQRLGVIFIHNSGFLMVFGPEINDLAQIPLVEILDAARTDQSVRSQELSESKRNVIAPKLG